MLNSQSASAHARRGRKSFCNALLLWAFLFASASAPLADARGPLDAAALRRLVDEAPTAEDRPDLDALVIFEGRYFDLEDEKVSVRTQRLLRVYTPFAIEHEGDPRLAFDSSRQELVVHASRTYLTDGNIVDSPANAYNEVTPRALALSVDHLTIREMVVTHAGLEPGVTILLDYTIRDTRPAPLVFQTVVFPQGRWPVQEMELQVDAGLASALVNPDHSLFPLPADAREKLRGGRTLWRFSALPAAPGEARHRLGDQLSWLEIRAGNGSLQEFAQMIEGAAQDREGLGEILAQLEEKSPWLSEREALSASAAMAAERTSLLRYDQRFLLVPRPVRRVLATSTATPAERCALLLACCQERGLPADIHLASRWQSLSDPGDLNLAHALRDPLLRVQDPEDRYWWVDPVQGSVSAYPPADAGFQGQFYQDGKTVPAAMISESDRIQLSFYWNTNEAEAKVEGRLSGPITESLNLAEPEALLRDWVQGWGDSSEATNLFVLSSGAPPPTEPRELAEPKGGLEFSLTAKFPIPEEDDRGRLALDLPLPPIDFEALRAPGLNLAHSRCRAVLVPPAPAHVQLRWTVDLPEDRSLLSDSGGGVTGPGASFILERYASEGRVVVDYNLDWDGGPVQPADYPAYRALILASSDPAQTRLVLGSRDED